MPIPTLYALYGFVGAGKSTFAAQLEAQGKGVVLSQDAWMIRLYGANPPPDLFQEYFDRVWALLLEESARFLKHGVSVILDHGFWSAESRRSIRQFAADNGADFKLFHLKGEMEVLRARVMARNATLTAGGAFYIDENTFELLKPRFEPLGVDEVYEVVEQNKNDR